jgi:hypothetical protein
VAEERALPVARLDTRGRRLTSAWIYAAEAGRPEVRRRYHLAVIAHPRAGLALHARIAREAPTGDGESGRVFEAVAREAGVADEEQAIVQRAYELYRSGE